jgi:hypothetical protein
MTFGHWILNEQGEPVQVGLMTWARWLETGKQQVADDQVGETRVSTVFLGLDHNYTGVGFPVLWETMCFGGPLDMSLRRCSGSREQALAMHAEVLAAVRAARPDKPCQDVPSMP